MQHMHNGQLTQGMCKVGVLLAPHLSVVEHCCTYLSMMWSLLWHNSCVLILFMFKWACMGVCSLAGQTLLPKREEDGVLVCLAVFGACSL